MFDLKSKTALITGAASGIGEAIANVLSAAGAHIIVADCNRRDGERVAGMLGEWSACSFRLS